MTREMNKPDWHYKWVYRERRDENNYLIKEIYKVERTLNPDVAEFFYGLNERLKK